VIREVVTTPIVNILLSTYNGELHLPELLDSLLQQSYPNVYITIRDDGSTDSTYSMISAWARRRSNVKATTGPTVGPTCSFLSLLSAADPNCDYFAFCDQDDLWLPEKVSRAVTLLEKQRPKLPAMYCSGVEYVDSRLQHLGFSRVPGNLAFSNALVENVAPGCTIVLNREARAILTNRLPSHALMHDAWCYLVVSAFGRVLYDPIRSVQYRQHDNNMLGGAANGCQRWFRRAKRIASRKGQSLGYFTQATDFHELFAARLPIDSRRILEDFLKSQRNLRNRAAYVIRMDVRRQTWTDTAILRALILLGYV
jgi:glycosyltransferase involved in cell wall biosynthesis